MIIQDFITYLYIKRKQNVYRDKGNEKTKKLQSQNQKYTQKIKL